MIVFVQEAHRIGAGAQKAIKRADPLRKNSILPLSGLIEDVYPFDVFRDGKLGSGRKSITFNVRFRSAEKTLTDQDVEEVCARITSTIEDRFGVRLRS